jgi:Glycosyl transferase family 2
VAEASPPPHVSVVIPTYQRAALVEAAVASVVEQSFRDFELIVVDDGSTDDTERTLAPYAGALRYERREHRGAAAARNAGLSLARGELVAFLDSDNLWLRDHLAVLAAILRERPAAVLASTCPGFITAGRASPADAVVSDPLPRLLAANFVGSPSCIAVRRDALASIGGFDEGLRVAEDVDAWLRLALEGPFAFLRRRTVVLRRSPDSLLASGRRQGHYLDAFERISSRMPAALTTAGRHDLVDRARGAAHLAAALRALDYGDDAVVAGELAAACALFPELSEEPGLVSGRLRVNLPHSDRPRDRLRQLATAARAWPEPASDTGVALRLQAAATALRLGRASAAAEMVFGLNGRATVALGRRSLPLVRSSLARRLSVRRAPP